MENSVMKTRPSTAILLLLGVVLAACSPSATGSEPSPTAADNESADMAAAEPVTAGETIAVGSSTPPPEPTQEPTPVPVVNLPDMGPAPEIENEVWLNTESPQRLQSLRGKVVLLEFWTFG